MIGCADFLRASEPACLLVEQARDLGFNLPDFLDHVRPRVGLDLRHGQAAVQFLQSGAQVIHAPVRVIGHVDHQNILYPGRFRWSPFLLGLRRANLLECYLRTLREAS
jgi:hypothetical protein